MTLPAGYSKTREYSCWRHMRRRCSNPKDAAYDYYGGRGISVAPEWGDFARFFQDVGPMPSPLHTLDRYPDNNGDYRPGNVRWATRQEQGRNTRKTKFVKLRGRDAVSLPEAYDVLGLNKNTIRGRLRSGWSPQEAISAPIRKKVTLSPSQKQAIRAARGISQDRLAATYGVSQSAISEIRNGPRKRRR